MTKSRWSLELMPIISATLYGFKQQLLNNRPQRELAQSWILCLMRMGVRAVTLEIFRCFVASRIPSDEEGFNFTLLGALVMWLTVHPTWMSHELTNFVCDYCTLETASHDRELRVPFPILIFSNKLTVSTDSQRQCFGDIVAFLRPFLPASTIKRFP